MSVFVLYLLILCAIAWLSVRPPRIPAYLSPSSLELPEEDVEIDSEGTTLRGWWVPAETPQATAIYAHGYVMNRCELLPEAMYWHKRGVSALLLDQRAHGRSGGRKCGFGLAESKDVQRAVEWAKEKQPGVPVFLLGSSMGAAAIALAAAEEPGLADALILDSAYSKLSHATLGWWRFVGGPVLSVLLAPVTVLAIPIAGFNPFKVDVAKALSSLSGAPVLFLHGDKDPLATPADAKRNLEACHTPAEIVWFEGCSHSEGRWLQTLKYRSGIERFLKAHGVLDSGTKRHPER